jgi:uncharacterized protein YfaS (alpha-2-macroglobulin family)
MSDWMLYVYKQFTRPANASGVPVSINVIDANGNYRTIGTATSSSDGFFSYTWTPDISGNYQVYAVFEGSNGYYGSHAENAFTVEEQAQPSATTQPVQSTPPFDIYIIALGIAVIAAIAVATLLILRKKP